MVPLPKNHIQRRTLGQLLGICFVCLFASNQHSAQASMWRPECDEACPELMNHFKAIDLDSSNHTGVKWKCRAEMKKWHPDKQVNKPEAERTAAKERFSKVEAACEALKAHKNDDELSGKLKNCKTCPDNSGLDGYGDLDETAFELAHGKGVTKSEEYYDRRGRRVPSPSGKSGSIRELYKKREVLCRPTLLMRSYECQALDYERVAGQWVPNPFGWFAYEPAATGEETGSDDGMFGGGDSYHDMSAYDPFLGGGDFMPNGGTVTSFDGSHFMIMLWDGNLAIYEGDSPKNAGKQPIWQSRSFTASPASYMMLQRDGNLVVKEGIMPGDDVTVPMDGGAVLWASNRRVSDLIPSKSPHDRLRRQQLFEDLMSSWSVHGILENDGNFVVYAKDDTSDESECLWASIKCPEQQPWQDIAGTVRAVKNAARLTVKAAKTSIGESLGGGSGGGSYREADGRRGRSQERFWLARPLEAVRKWFARRRRQ